MTGHHPFRSLKRKSERERQFCVAVHYVPHDHSMTPWYYTVRQRAKLLGFIPYWKKVKTFTDRKKAERFCLEQESKLT